MAVNIHVPNGLIYYISWIKKNGGSEKCGKTLIPIFMVIVGTLEIIIPLILFKTYLGLFY